LKQNLSRYYPLDKPVAHITQVVIVGAGPTGLLLGLRLAKENINVTVLEKGLELDKQPRASHYSAPAIIELRRAGVLDDVRQRGFIPNAVCWRKVDGTYLAGIPLNVEGDQDATTCLPLDKLGKILLEHISRYPEAANVLWSHNVVAIEQHSGGARVTAESPDGEKTFDADYVIGCDGANSKVRRTLFGDRNFPGKTWDEQIVATNVGLP